MLSWLSAIALAAGTLSLDGCARALHTPVHQPTSAVIAQLWQAPDDLERRDLVDGPGGAELTPAAVPYAFVAEKTSGKNPGYDVRDPQGRLWSVKLGEEAQSEVVVSRVLWAVGFHQPPTYYVAHWKMSGFGAADKPAGRFRAEVAGEESWASGHGTTTPLSDRGNSRRSSP
jgi:hypothetical protein